MTATDNPVRQRPERAHVGTQIVRVITTTDHKVIGKLYLTTSFLWFLAAGIMALIMRSELAFPENQLVRRRAVQPALHHARHDHAAALRDAAVRSASPT
jgi:hypothetical protein